MVPSLSIGVRVSKRGVANMPLKECRVVSATCHTVHLCPQHEEVIHKNGLDCKSHVHIADPCPRRSEILSHQDTWSRSTRRAIFCPSNAMASSLEGKVL